MFEQHMESWEPTEKRKQRNKKNVEHYWETLLACAKEHGWSKDGGEMPSFGKRESKTKSQTRMNE